MKTYENNMADQALVVKSLRVLENVDGGAFKEIKQNVEAVKKQTNVLSRQQEEYWKTLSNDGVITPIEKQTLLRESRNIDRSFAAITQQAATLGIASAILEDYVDTYDDIHSYLFTTLKLFDDMTSETQIDDRDTFNSYFSSYYFSENFVLLAITAGILDTIDFRVLQSLTEPGEEDETAIYHGALYQYVNGEWKNVTTGAYKGPRTELPPDEEEAFFIVSESFTMSESLIVNDEELLVNSDTLLVTHTYLKGYIYYFQAGTWHPEWDKTSWRYAAAFADVLNITGELPQIFQDGLDAIQANLDAAVLTLEDEIAAKQGQYTIIGGEMVLIDDLLPEIVDNYNQQQTEIDSKISHLPEYFGGRNTNPVSPQEGDFYLYTGSGSDNCKVKRYHNASWETLDPSDTNYRNYYMMALEDILANSGAGTATFSNAFAQNFWAACASMNTLDVKTIYLRNQGSIQSSNFTYSEEEVGLRIDADGNIDANGNTHLGATTDNKVAIGVPLTGNTDFNTYDVVIGGKTLIRDSVGLKGEVISDNVSIIKAPNDTVLEGIILNNDLELVIFLKRVFDKYGTDSVLPNDMYITLTKRNGLIIQIIQTKKIQLDYFGSYHRTLNPAYLHLDIWDGDQWQRVINTTSTEEEAWEEINTFYTASITKVMGNHKRLVLSSLELSEPGASDVLWNDNGILKVSDNYFPFHYLSYLSGYDTAMIAAELIRYLTDGISVGCIGFWGTSCVNRIKRDGNSIYFYDNNDSRILTADVEYNSDLDRKLEIIFISG